MENIDIKDFQTVTGVDPVDHVLLVLSDGSNGKVSLSMLKEALKMGISPSIGPNGNWYIGNVDTGFRAETGIEFRAGEIGMEYKYSGQEDWMLAIKYADMAPGVLNAGTLVISEDAYDNLVQSGSVDESMFYFIHEDE